MTTGTRLWLLERFLPSLRRTYTGDVLIVNYNDFGEEDKAEFRLRFSPVIIIDEVSQSNAFPVDRFRVYAEFLGKHLLDYDVIMCLDGNDMVVNDITPLLTMSEKGFTIFEDGGTWKDDKVMKEDLWHINQCIPEADWKLVENRTILQPASCGGPIVVMYPLFLMIWDYCKRYCTRFGMDLYAMNIVVRAHHVSYTHIPLSAPHTGSSIDHYGGYEPFKFKAIEESFIRRQSNRP